MLLVGLSNSVHLVATILWIGWSALLPTVIAPRALEAHGDEPLWVAVLARRAAPVAYGALAALGATGMLQMGASPHYEGMFALANPWSALLLAKHLLVLASVGLILYLAQGLGPRLRLAARYRGRPTTHDTASLVARFRALAWLNAALGLAILLLTGFMTAIP